MKRENFNKNWLFWKDGKTAEKAEVYLPHDAMILEERQPDLEHGSGTGYYPGGKYYYQKTLYAPQEYADKAVILEFDGVYMKPTIFLNGQKVGEWVYGYTAFYVDLTGKLKIGQENTILVEVDNSLTPNSRWYTGSGIYRDVCLYVGNKKHILPDGIKVKTVSYDPAVVEIEVETSQPGTVMCTVLDVDDTVALTVGNPVQVEIPDAKLWSDEQPYLYTVKAQMVEDGQVIDEAVCRMGIRKVEYSSVSGLQINGKTVKLRGGCIHHDHGPLGAREYEKAERRRIKKLKAMGYNAVRYAHNPSSRILLDLCDEMGMYILEESFDQWQLSHNKGDYAIYFDDNWQKDVASMVHKDFSHPSVIMYCLGNEITETGLPSGAGLCKMLHDEVKRLDNTRPTTIAINGLLAVLASKNIPIGGVGGDNVGSQQANEAVTSIDDIQSSITADLLENLIGPCFESVDIAGYNYGDKVYSDTHEKQPQRVILSTETFPKAIGINWPMIERSPYVIGDFMWTCWDYLGESGVGQPAYGVSRAPFAKTFPSRCAYVGAFDLTGMPEPFAYYTSIVWGKYDKPYIAVRPVNHSGEAYTMGMWRMTDARHSWSWSGCEGREAEIEVYSSAKKVVLLLNGEKVGEGEPEYCKCMFKIAYKPGRLEAVAFDEQGNETGRDMMVSAGCSSRLTILPEEDCICADGYDLAYVAVHITDENGELKMLEDKKISIKAEGAGVLEAFGSAQPGTEEGFNDSSSVSYYGRVLAIIRSNGQKGEIKITAWAEDMEPVTAVISAQ